MRFAKLCAGVYLLTATALPAVAGVYVTSPASATVAISGSVTTSSPVHFVATANSPACPTGVAGLGIYTAPSVLAYTVSGSSLDTNLSLAPGTYNIAVQEWEIAAGRRKPG
jgi:phospholipase C